MPDNDADSEILKASVERFEASRHSFIRDLKFVVPLALLFYIFVFCRYTDLSARLDQQTATITQLSSDYSACTNVETELLAALTVFRKGEASFSTNLNTFADGLRRQFLALEDALSKFRGQPFPEPPTPSDISTSVLQIPPTAASPDSELDHLPEPQRRFFAGLARSNLLHLHSAKPSDEKWQSIAKSIVEDRIVEPEFERLNSQWRNLVIDPVEKHREILLMLTNHSARLLPEITSLPGQFEATWQRVVNHRFLPPEKPSWWRSFDEKREAGNLMKRDEGLIKTTVTTNFSSFRASLSGLSGSLEKNIAAARHQESELAANLKELEKRTDNLQDQLNKYLSGMPVISMPLRDVAQYFPALIAAAAGIFLWRFHLLRNRAMNLSRLYAKRGASQHMLALKFPEAKRNITLEWTAISSTLLLIGISTKQALANKDLAEGFPWTFLVTSLLLTAIIFITSWRTRTVNSAADATVDPHDAVLR